jgi:spore germination cell wall hydrolase CwlJ-like protein
MTANFTLPYEPRPSDFSARLRRLAPTIGARAQRRHIRRRAMALLAAVAVLAFAAPDAWQARAWQAFEIGDAGAATVLVDPMPFEKAGDSFPGSAFYYLAADDQAHYWSTDPDAPLVAGIHGDADTGSGITSPGPAARALRIDNSGVDRSRALQCMTAAIYYEAASEPDAGQRAVAQVVLNRVAHPAYPNTVCGVVYQGSERRTGCQFSFTCDGSLARVPARMFWLRAENVARAALSGFVYSPVGLATHYHTIAVHPYWAPSLALIGTIGAHQFYTFRGAAGQPGAFRFAYGGGEPAAAPHLRSAAAVAGEDMTLDPLAIQRAYDSGFKSAQANAFAPSASGSGLAPARLAPAPAYAPELQKRGGEHLYRGENLPEASGIRPEYANSGAWITPPGT